MTIILQGIVGSQAYGLAHADSDIDRLGVFVAPLSEILSLNQPQETLVYKTGEGDVTLHELGKFLKLAVQCNPTVMELLWLPEYEVQDPVWGAALVGLRNYCLSKRALDAYMGYTSQQAKRLLNRGGTFDPDLKKRTQKHGRHCWRLMLQGAELARTGALRVKLTEHEADECRRMGLYAETDPQSFADIVEGRIQALKNQPTILPDKADVDTVNNVLYAARLSLKD